MRAADAAAPPRAAQPPARHACSRPAALRRAALPFAASGAQAIPWQRVLTRCCVRSGYDDDAMDDAPDAEVGSLCTAFAAPPAPCSACAALGTRHARLLRVLAAPFCLSPPRFRPRRTRLGLFAAAHLARRSRRAAPPPAQLEEAEEREDAEAGAGGIEILEGDAPQAPPEEGACACLRPLPATPAHAAAAARCRSGAWVLTRCCFLLYSPVFEQALRSRA